MKNQTVTQVTDNQTVAASAASVINETLGASSEASALAPVVFDAAAWDKLEQQRQQMLDARVRQLFGQYAIGVQGLKKLEREIGKAVGDEEKARQQMLLLAVKHADDKGILLGDLRRYIPDPNHLNDARDALLNPVDDDGNKLPALIEQKRAENNEVRLYQAGKSNLT